MASGCAAFARPVALDFARSRFSCERCGLAGRVVRETLDRSDHGDVVDEVRIVYGYDPQTDVYALVEGAHEPSLLGCHNVVTLRTPLVDHPQVARMLAEILLAQLNERFRRRAAPARPTRAELISEGWEVLS
jgi:hypothetical protein